ncbi:hypothetical protein [Amycolatopsis sp. NPDC051903]|uniref:hypothetical protein n=1 Tax=Amycolatopsis sp. NPDC051903 TaxID=3363936 RepID=UPI00379269AC
MLAAFVVLLGVVVAGAGTAGAAGYPTTNTPRIEFPGSATESTITWYARSVNIQGYVVDSKVQAGSTTVKFWFYQANTYVASQSRTASAGTVSFNFTQDGPVGGITKILIQLCNPAGCASPGSYFYRP